MFIEINTKYNNKFLINVDNVTVIYFDKYHEQYCIKFIGGENIIFITENEYNKLKNLLVKGDK